MTSSRVLWKSYYTLFLKKCLRPCPDLSMTHVSTNLRGWNELFQVSLDGFQKFFLFWEAGIILEAWDIEFERAYFFYVTILSIGSVLGCYQLLVEFINEKRTLSETEQPLSAITLVWWDSASWESKLSRVLCICSFTLNNVVIKESAVVTTELEVASQAPLMLELKRQRIIRGKEDSEASHRS